MEISMIKLTGATYADGQKEIGNRAIAHSIEEYEALAELGYQLENESDSDELALEV